MRNVSLLHKIPNEVGREEEDVEVNVGSAENPIDDQESNGSDEDGQENEDGVPDIGGIQPIEIIDIECVLGNLAGTQIEKKIALINPLCRICPRSGLCELQWGEFNLPL